MREGDLTLTRLPQEGVAPKLRPVVLLRRIPPFDDFLVCGVSTQLRHVVAGFDEIIQPGHADFAAGGLKQTSLIRLGLLIALSASAMPGRIIGTISPERHRRLLANLSRHLRP